MKRENISTMSPLENVREDSTEGSDKDGLAVGHKGKAFVVAVGERDGDPVYRE